MLTITYACWGAFMPKQQWKSTSHVDRHFEECDMAGIFLHYSANVLSL